MNIIAHALNNMRSTLSNQNLIYEFTFYSTTRQLLIYYNSAIYIFINDFRISRDYLYNIALYYDTINIIVDVSYRDIANII